MSEELTKYPLFLCFFSPSILSFGDFCMGHAYTSPPLCYVSLFCLYFFLSFFFATFPLFGFFRSLPRQQNTTRREHTKHAIPPGVLREIHEEEEKKELRLPGDRDRRCQAAVAIYSRQDWSCRMMQMEYERGKGTDAGEGGGEKEQQWQRRGEGKRTAPVV